MKKILSFFLLSFSLFFFTQSKSDIGKLYLGISFNEDQLNNFDQNLLKKIEGKLTQFLAEKGIAASGYNNGLVIEPNIIINSNEIVEGGMQNINVTKITLQLLIKQDQTQKIFASLSKELKGTGKTTDLAINNAINSLSANDSSISNFIEKSKSKINQYYEQNCSSIINKANSLEKAGQYEEALAIIMSVPESVSCYNLAQNKALETYKNYQKKNCNIIIKQAQASIAEKKYSFALESLTQIDSTSPCEAESNALIKSVENKISAEEKKELDILMKLHNDAVSLEKTRINAIKDIAAAYYKSKTLPSHTVIVK
jgi:hypothetical protein